MAHTKIVHEHEIIDITGTFSSTFGTLSLKTTPTAAGIAAGYTKSTAIALHLTREEAAKLAQSLLDFLDETD